MIKEARRILFCATSMIIGACSSSNVAVPAETETKQAETENNIVESNSTKASEVNADAKQATAEPKPTTQGQPSDGAIRIAVNYFENTSGQANLDMLKRGLAEMLVTDLSVSEDLQLVERSRLNDLLAELKLSKSRFVNADAAVKLGRGLGASYIIVGSYMVQGSTLRVDARALDVETSDIILSVKESGTTTDFIKVEQGLAGQLLSGLGAKLSPIGRKRLSNSSTSNFEAFKSFSTGLQHIDDGEKEAAKTALAKALKLDPNFRAAKTWMDALEARMTRLESAVDSQGSQLDLITGGSGQILVQAGKLADAGDGTAMLLLGLNAVPDFGRSSTPWGSPPSGSESLKWFRRSARAGNPWAGYWAAGFASRFEDADPEQIRKLLKKSLKDGSPCQSQYALGVLAWQKGDLEKAMKWFKQVAEFSPKKCPVKTFYFPRKRSDVTSFKRNGVRPATYKGLPVWEQDTWLQCDAWVFAAMYNVAALYVEHKKDIPSFVQWMNRIYLDPRARDIAKDNGNMLGQFIKTVARDSKDDVSQYNFEAPSDLWSPISLMEADSAARIAAYTLARYYRDHTNQKNKELRWHEAQIALCDANPRDCEYINDIRSYARRLKADGITASESP